MTMGAAQSQLVQDQQQEAPWRQEVLDLLKELVLVQKEVAKSQGQVVQQLGMLGTQVGLRFSSDLVWIVFRPGLVKSGFI